jgi:transposase
MKAAHESLPSNPDQLKELVAALLSEKESLDSEKESLLSENKSLNAQMRLMQLKLQRFEELHRLQLAKNFGVSSEKSPQALLFDEAESLLHEEFSSESATVENADEEPISVPSQQRRKRGRVAIPEDLERQEVVHDLVDDEKTCPCGCQLSVIGEETSEQIDVQPPVIRVLRHIRKKYACKGCEDTVKTAAKPTQPIERSNASPGLLAYVATAKFCDALPLYRQSGIFERFGVQIPRATLANWMIRSGELVQPLLNLIQEHILGYAALQMDETPLQVLKEPGKTAQSESYMWVQRGGPPGQRGVLYHYSPSRAGSVPVALLDGYQGYLQTDGYAGYNAVLAKKSITGLGCWAHARRKFVDAQKAAGKKKNSRADTAVSLIAKLYKTEKQIRDLPPEEKHRIRQERSKPQLAKIKVWLDDNLHRVPPKTKLGEALHYLAAQWERLTIYIKDGRLEIDNNGIERAIRPFAVGKKNWLFANSQAGAKASAALYSLIETAKLHGQEPYRYLKQVFTELPKAQSLEDIECLLPWNITNVSGG